MWYAGAVEAQFEATATGRTMAKGRSLSQFQETFPDEASCAAFLSERRWPEGFPIPAVDDLGFGGMHLQMAGFREFALF